MITIRLEYHPPEDRPEERASIDRQFTVEQLVRSYTSPTAALQTASVELFHVLKANCPTLRKELEDASP